MPDITFQVTFHESGFSYDDYPIELAWTLRTTSTAGGAVSRTSGTDKRPRYVKEFLLFLGLVFTKITICLQMTYNFRGSVEKTSQQKDGRGSASSSASSNISQQQPRKMTFMEQVNKRKGKTIFLSSSINRNLVEFN